MQILVLFGLMILLLLIGVPIVFSIGLASISYSIIFDTFKLIQIPTRMYGTNDSFIYLAIPLFILAGYIMEMGGISRRLVDFVQKLIGRIPGALGTVAIVTCMIFAALTGSAAATVAAIGSIMYPLMVENGYDKKTAGGIIAAAGALGPIIPPSIPMVVYGANMGVSVGNLFIGGIIPGVLMGGGFIAYNTIYAKRHNLPRSTERYKFKEIFKSFLRSFPLLMLPVIILGGIYGGYVTPTEAATIAVIYSFILTLCYRTFSWKKFTKTLEKTVINSGVILAIIDVAGLFGFCMSIDSIPTKIASALLPYMKSPTLFLAILFVILIVVGCVMDTAPAILILGPILVPMGVSLGLDPMYIGVVFTIVLISGMMTPPFGLSLFAMCSTGNMRFEEVVKGILPLLIIVFTVLLLITFCEPLAMLLIPGY